ncbi:MAG: copper chaperone PCu(A)C [Casimicrobiaceae bacterium]
MVITLRLPLILSCSSLVFMANLALAQVIVTDAWVRGTVPGQRATGAFMQLLSATDQTLVAASSPSAKFVEIHEMTMESGVMKMRAIDQLGIRAGQTVDLKTGGHHLMLLDLHAPLNVGDTVAITLTWQDRTGSKTMQEVAVLVRPLTTPSGGAHKH